MFLRRRIFLLAGCLLLLLVPMPVFGAASEEAQLQPSTSDHSSNFESGTSTTVAELSGLSREELIERIGEMCQEDYQRTGILASVSAAQCILESGYLSSTLAVDANNCFGMKTELSGNDWDNSTWDGVSTCTKQTSEEYNGSHQTIIASFRAYDSIEDSISDHSAYLLGAKLDSGTRRYEGVEQQTDYRQAVQLIGDGGYATGSSYVQQVCSLIESYDLTRFDVLETDTHQQDKDKNKASSQSAETASQDDLYRVRKSWDDASSQIGAFRDLTNARNACSDGYKVYDSQGREVQ